MSRGSDRKERIKLSLLGGLGGGFAGYGAMTADNPLKYMITRRLKENYLPVYAGMSFGGRQGTGELVVASNLARELRRKGFNTQLFDPEVLNARNHMALYRAMVDKHGKSVADNFVFNPGYENELGPYLWNEFKNDPNGKARHQFELSLYGLANKGNVSLEMLKGKTPDEIMLLAKDKKNPLSVLVGMLRNPGESDVNPRLVRKFVKKLNAGAFDGIPVGILRDYFKTAGVSDILSGKVVVGSPDKLRSALQGAKQFATGEANMFYSALPLSRRDDWDVVGLTNGFRGGREVFPFADPRIKNVTPELIERAAKSGIDISDGKELVKWLDSNAEKYVMEGGGPRALHTTVGMSTNYSPTRKGLSAADELVPFSKVRSGISNRSDFLAGIGHRRSKRRVLDFILSQNKGELTRKDLLKKKIILLTAGGSGLDIEPKLQALSKALEGRDDVHVLVQGGTPSQFNRNLQSIVDQANRTAGYRKFTPFSVAPYKTFQSMADGADLVASYGGSSTLTEALGSRTPTIILHDQKLNRDNANWARSSWGLPTADTAAYAARIKGDAIADRIGVPRDYFWSHNAWIDSSVKDGTRGGGFGDVKIQGSRNTIKSLAPYASEMSPDKFISDFRGQLDDLLDNGSRIRKSRGSKVREFLRYLKSRNKSVVQSAKAIQGGLKMPGKYKAIGSAIGALGLGGASYAASRAMRPKPDAQISRYVVPGIAGLAGIGGLAYYLDRRSRKKEQEEKEMSKAGSFRREAVLEAVTAALAKKASDDRRRVVRIAVRQAMQKRAGVLGGLKNVLKGLGFVGKGVGQVGAGALKPAARAVSTAAGSKLERLARSGRPDLMLEYIRKMRIAQGLFGAGILGGGAALASNVEWD